MFGLKGLIKREIRKTIRSVVSSPSRKTVVTKTTIKQVQTRVEPKVITGTCHVIDGDTIAIGKQKIRLAGINAPELNEPWGQKAKWELVGLCKGQKISAHLTGETTYDRVVAKCFLEDGRDLAAEMVKAELALDLPHYCCIGDPDADYKHLETFQTPGVSCIGDQRRNREGPPNAPALSIILTGLNSKLVIFISPKDLSQ